jgi:hypothetical protein
MKLSPLYTGIYIHIRLAARVVHRGGFGTCVPGAWSGPGQPAGRCMANRTVVSHLHLNANLGPGPATARRDQVRPVARAPGIKLREHGLNVPKVDQTEGLRNPHSVTRQQPHQSPARDPPLPDATKSLQSRGDRDRTPTRMAVITVGGKHPDRSPTN